jgi:hypothetical protein
MLVACHTAAQRVGLRAPWWQTGRRILRVAGSIEVIDMSRRGWANGGEGRG